ncbi:TolB-like 6-blade propeller-like [Tangfeifania diversioriginum]|uniref:TolB-like 6-blade propeller-like n=1 Tax=Tangfeifania diversioriginum TaxID=1168035 RepID=A0A1M6PE54_9BACT|nr:BF3164 family lipoprotein [Tangfeifania diversioriginum]SHK06194.1 TolB-like 6-blade propeller-like [Tangfeifania diversioriginum]
MILVFLNFIHFSKLKTFYYFLIIYFFLVACNSKNDWTSEIKSTEDFINAFPKEYRIKPEIYIDDSINLITPVSIHLVGDILLVNNAFLGNKYFFSVFDLKSKKYFGEFLKRGKGPHEYLRIGGVENSMDSLMILDYYKKRLCYFSQESVRRLNNKPDICYPIQSAKNDGNIMQMFKFRNMLIGTGAFVDGRFGLFSRKGVLFKKFGEYPYFNFKDTLSVDHMGSLFGIKCSFCSNMDNTQLAFTSEYSINLYYYNYESDIFSDYFCVQWGSPAIADVGYKKGKPFVAKWIEESYATAGDLVSVGKYIIFPFSGLSKIDIARYGITDYYKYLLVMDWEGNPVVRFSLDKAIKGSLIKDNSEEYLYSIHTSNSSGFRQIMRFDIENLLNIIEQNENK